MHARAIWILLLFVMFLAGQPAASEPPAGLPAATPDFVRLHAEGLRQYGLKQYGKAIEAWQEELELLRDGPRKAVVLNDLALAYRELKDYEKAMQYNRQALALDPNLGRTYFGIGANHAAMRNYGQARDAFLIAAALKYRPGLTYVHLGYAYLRMSEYKKAEAMLLTALQLGHDPVECHRYLGEVYTKEGDWRKAAASYESLLKIKPSQPGAHYGLGMSYKALQDNWRARRAFREEVALASPWWDRAAKELRDLEHYESGGAKMKSYALSVMFAILILLVALLLPLGLVRLFRRREGWLKASGTKTLLTYLLLLVLPVPMMVLTAGGLYPPIPGFVGFMYLTIGFFKAVNLLGPVFVLAYYLGLALLCYLLACLFVRAAKSRIEVYAAAAAAVVLSLLPIYPYCSMGGVGYPNSLRVYQNLAWVLFQAVVP